MHNKGHHLTSSDLLLLDARIRLRRWLWVCSRGSTGTWEQPTEQEIVDLLPSGSGVGVEDIIVTSLKLNLTAGNSNPLDKVSFYDMYESTEKRVLKHSDMTALQLQNFEVNTFLTPRW